MPKKRKNKNREKRAIENRELIQLQSQIQYKRKQGFQNNYCFSEKGDSDNIHLTERNDVAELRSTEVKIKTELYQNKVVNEQNHKNDSQQSMNVENPDVIIDNGSLHKKNVYFQNSFIEYLNNDKSISTKDNLTEDKCVDAFERNEQIKSHNDLLNQGKAINKSGLEGNIDKNFHFIEEGTEIPQKMDSSEADIEISRNKQRNARRKNTKKKHKKKDSASILTIEDNQTYIEEDNLQIDSCDDETQQIDKGLVTQKHRESIIQTNEENIELSQNEKISEIDRNNNENVKAQRPRTSLTQLLDYNKLDHNVRNLNKESTSRSGKEEKSGSESEHNKNEKYIAKKKKRKGKNEHSKERIANEKKRKGHESDSEDSEIERRNVKKNKIDQKDRKSNATVRLMEKDNQSDLDKVKWKNEKVDISKKKKENRINSENQNAKKNKKKHKKLNSSLTEPMDINLDEIHWKKDAIYPSSKEMHSEIEKNESDKHSTKEKENGIEPGIVSEKDESHSTVKKKRKKGNKKSDSTKPHPSKYYQSDYDENINLSKKRDNQGIEKGNNESDSQNAKKRKKKHKRSVSEMNKTMDNKQSDYEEFNISNEKTEILPKRNTFGMAFDEEDFKNPNAKKKKKKHKTVNSPLTEPMDNNLDEINLKKDVIHPSSKEMHSEIENNESDKHSVEKKKRKMELN